MKPFLKIRPTNVTQNLKKYLKIPNKETSFFHISTTTYTMIKFYNARMPKYIQSENSITKYKFANNKSFYNIIKSLVADNNFKFEVELKKEECLI